MIIGNGKTREVFINGTRLWPTRSQDIINHSPDGFNWGYEGSGPAQLALAILIKFSKKQVAIDNYQQYKRDVIAYFTQGEDFELDEIEVMEWLTNHSK